VTLPALDRWLDAKGAAMTGDAPGNVKGVPSNRAMTGQGAAPARPRLGDVLLAAVTVAVQLAVVHASAGWHGHSGAGPWGDVLLAAAGAALVLRRRYPGAVLMAALAATFIVKATSHAGAVWVVLIVAFFSAVLAGRRKAAVISLLAGYVAALWPPWLVGRHGGPSLLFALWLAAWLVILLTLAELIRLRYQRGRALAHGREQELRRRASEERMRIARDLHDVVAHNISVINVQANTALHLKGRQPERAWEALSTINEVSKQALIELRSVLGVLRQVDEGEPRAPVAGLARIGELIERARAAGLKVKLTTEGQPQALPVNIDLAAYRIVQEALTNSAKHAAGAEVTVRIACTGAGVVVEVEDNGSAKVPSPPRALALAGGNGLAGMRERAAALQGRLAAGPRPGGGFRVAAWLPLDTP
jgi:signal transduction histidine kinase